VASIDAEEATSVDETQHGGETLPEGEAERHAEGGDEEARRRRRGRRGGRRRRGREGRPDEAPGFDDGGEAAGVAAALGDEQPSAQHVELMDPGPAEMPRADEVADVESALHEAPLERVPETLGAEAVPEVEAGLVLAEAAEPHPAPAGAPSAAEQVELVTASEPAPAAAAKGAAEEPAAASETSKPERQENLAAPKPILIDAPPANPKRGWWRRAGS